MTRPTESNIPEHQWPSWNKAPVQFKYPWGWQYAGVIRRQGPRPRYKRRRLTAFERKMLDRITSSKKPDTEVHPDQLYLL